MAEPQQEPVRAARVNALAAFIVKRLDELHLHRAAFAERVGVSRTTLYKLLGPTPPEALDPRRLQRMADVLQVDVSVLESLWDGTVWANFDPQREDLGRAFVLATADLTPEDAQTILDLARQTADALRAARGGA